MLLRHLFSYFYAIAVPLIVYYIRLRQYLAGLYLYKTACLELAITLRHAIARTAIAVDAGTDTLTLMIQR